MAQTSVQLAPIDEHKSLTHEQQQEIRISVASQGRPKPIPDLLNGTSKENMKIAIPLYEASIRGDWKAAKEILDERPELVRYSVTGNNETALHVAASTKSTKQVEQFVENLMTKMEKEDLELKNNSSNTALCLAAAVGNVKMVELMVKKCRALVAITGSGGMTPLYMAALFGHSEVVKYLYKNSQKLRDDYWTPQNRGWLLQKCVENDMFDIALDIVREHEELSSSGIVLAALARKTDAFAEIKSNIFMRTIKWVICRKTQAREKESKAKALEILKTVWCYIAEKPREEIDTILRGPPDPPVKRYEKPAFDKIDEALQLLKHMSDNIVKIPIEIRNIIKGPVARNLEGLAGNVRKKYSSRVLFVATEVGNTRFVVELMRLYPDLAWKVNDNNQSIFHVAARHRQADIYNLLHEIGLNKDMIIPLKDQNEDNMLHLVARSVERKRLEDVSGGAFQMQRELLWFKEVEKMVLPSYRERKNKDGLTPREIFTKEHQDLVVKGEEWMKGTASQCMVVAALIATIVFAAAFTVPGGYDETNGIPFFRRNVSFLIFVVADAISLFSSSASILTFLSILTSRYAEDDFLESLPRKLMLGLATLYLSITTMMIAFSVTFFVLYREHLKWIPILVTVIATTPVLLFAALQYRLLKDVIHSTYGSSYLFRSNNHLYNEKSNSNHRCFPFRIPFISRCTSKILKLL
ncbi:unnamed protein product [Lactuca saligna]|uniref:PGG domain-containing protein n=1 Tax=Lactuca saligna TaxID=75948 RepID=A0AA35YB77_LACSI|nr:unnamed protein product [Lactuca saligna]